MNSASTSSTGLSSLRDEAATASSPKASIPSAEPTFVVTTTYGVVHVVADAFDVNEAYLNFFNRSTRTYQVTGRVGGRFRWSDWFKRPLAHPSEQVCEEVRTYVRSIKHEAILDVSYPASGTDARSGETEGLDPKDDGPVGESRGAPRITAKGPSRDRPPVL